MSVHAQANMSSTFEVSMNFLTRLMGPTIGRTGGRMVASYGRL